MKYKHHIFHRQNIINTVVRRGGEIFFKRVNLLPFVIAGYSDGANCVGGGTVVINFSNDVTFTELTVPNGVTITATGGKTYSISATSGTGTSEVTYTGTWSGALISGDVVNYAYDGLGDYTDINSNSLDTQDFNITNCIDFGALLETTTGTPLLETTTGTLITET